MPSRWTLDLSQNDDTIEERVIGDYPGDVPRIDDRRVGQPYKHSYMGMVDPARPMRMSGPVGPGFNMIGRLDVEAATSDTWFGSDDDSFQEPQFAPVGDGELNGYVLVVIEKHDSQLSDVGVFRAGDIALGPVAIIKFPLRLRGAVHGCWVSEHQLRVA